MFNMLSAVFAGSAACGKLDGECARCPACPLHAPPEEGFDGALEELCAVCREQYSQQMFFCDLAPRHRVHLACGLDMARAQGHGGRLRCPQCRDGSLSRMTPSCAAELLLRSRIIHPLRSVLGPQNIHNLDGPAREHFLRESIRSLDSDLRAMHETRNNLVLELLTVDSGQGDDDRHPEEPVPLDGQYPEQYGEQWTRDAMIALCVALMGVALCICMSIAIDRNETIPMLFCAFGAVVCFVAVCTWAANCAPALYPFVIIVLLCIPPALSILYSGGASFRF